jgi:hypothetical protein
LNFQRLSQISRGFFESSADVLKVPLKIRNFSDSFKCSATFSNNLLELLNVQRLSQISRGFFESSADVLKVPLKICNFSDSLKCSATFSNNLLNF